MKKPAIYYRVSTSKQDIESQKADVESYLKLKGFDPTAVPVYSDVGSGKSNDRPQFQQMIADAMKGKIDNIVVYKLDRFSRNASSAIQLILKLDDGGVGFISVHDEALQLGTENPFRKTILSAFAEIAEIERINIVKRIKSGMAAAMARGVKMGPPTKVTDEIRAEIFKLRGEGLTIRKIAEQVGLGRNTVHLTLKAKAA